MVVASQSRAATGQADLTTGGGERCPVCDARCAPRIDVGDFQLFECPACGCWSSDAQVRGAAVSFVPESYFDNADHDRDKWESLFQRLPDHGKGVARVLDVGCGTGAFLRHAGLRFDGADLVGIELDAQRVARARAANPKAMIHEGDALEVARRLDGAFDLITLWDVFEHVTAPTSLLSALSRLLAPEGTLYLQTIHEQSLVPAAGRLAYRLSAGRLRFPVRRTHEPHHLVFFSRAGLAHAAERAGLHIRELWFDRLAHSRMDGAPLLTGLAALALRAENAFGGGLFVNLLLEPATGADAAR
jgi:2-polyprenyl-3-methyl-5-hydroxy-6-metoxy-1,4-benzoquinol methylase